MATGVGAAAGLALSGTGIGNFLIDLACASVIRRCTLKALANGQIMQWAKHAE